jgi:hypothetical protein
VSRATPASLVKPGDLLVVSGPTQKVEQFAGQGKGAVNPAR